MSYKKEFLKELKEKRTNYQEMIEYCCDDMILNNYILEELAKQGYYFEFYCGSDVYFIDNNGETITQEQADEMDLNEYLEQYKDIYQYYIISSNSAERLSEFTNEIVMYNDDLDLYFLCVTHWGTAWNGVPANWKELDEVREDD